MGQALTEKRQKELLTLSERLGIAFRDLALLDQALTHTSYANESVHRKVVHNERLEFLGDAVLELSTSTYLFKQFPLMPEGDLTKARASVVCEAALHRRAAEVDLGAFLLLGNGEQATGGRERPSILADAFEAVIGALYLDQGWQAASDYVVRGNESARWRGAAVQREVAGKEASFDGTFAWLVEDVLLLCAQEAEVVRIESKHVAGEETEESRLCVAWVGKGMQQRLYYSDLMRGRE